MVRGTRRKGTMSLRRHLPMSEAEIPYRGKSPRRLSLCTRQCRQAPDSLHDYTGRCRPALHRSVATLPRPATLLPAPAQRLSLVIWGWLVALSSRPASTPLPTLHLSTWTRWHWRPFLPLPGTPSSFLLSYASTVSFSFAAELGWRFHLPSVLLAPSSPRHTHVASPGGNFLARTEPIEEARAPPAILDFDCPSELEGIIE
jgi:hypothetical protein